MVAFGQLVVSKSLHRRFQFPGQICSIFDLVLTKPPVGVNNERRRRQGTPGRRLRSATKAASGQDDLLFTNGISAPMAVGMRRRIFSSLGASPRPLGVHDEMPGSIDCNHQSSWVGPKVQYCQAGLRPSFVKPRRIEIDRFHLTSHEAAFSLPRRHSEYSTAPLRGPAQHNGPYGTGLCRRSAVAANATNAVTPSILRKTFHLC